MIFWDSSAVRISCLNPTVAAEPQSAQSTQRTALLLKAQRHPPLIPNRISSAVRAYP